MLLHWAPVEQTPINFPNRPNGGWYNDKECTEAWGSVRVIPDAEYMNKETLMTANPPPGVPYQPASFPRPGNNEGWKNDLVLSYDFILSPQSACANKVASIKRVRFDV